MEDDLIFLYWMMTPYFEMEEDQKKSNGRRLQCYFTYELQLQIVNISTCKNNFNSMHVNLV